MSYKNFVCFSFLHYDFLFLSCMFVPNKIYVCFLTALSVMSINWSMDNTSVMIALFVRMTPFGSPVVPLVYIIVHISVFCFGGSSQSKEPWETSGSRWNFWKIWLNWTVKHYFDHNIIKGTWQYQHLTSSENSFQEKRDTPSSSASFFCVLETYAKLTIVEEGR